MAVIENHPITSTVNLSLKYGKSDKIAERKSDEIMKQILFDEIKDSDLVVYKTFTTTLNHPEMGDIYNSFKRNMDMFGKNELKIGNSRTKDGKPIIAWHYIQSFQGQVDAVTANEIGVRLAEKMFPDFPVQISTHTDKDNTHNHIILCAWANDGHKWHQCNQAYREIRKESDRLCDEYGLSVIEHTRNQKLIEWKDSSGKKHYYEPTDRKNELLSRREHEESITNNVGNYRETDAYRKKKQKETSLTKQIKNDIDRFLPYAMSYEHLLQMLRENGYRIKDRKKNGDWLSYVTFTPPGAAPDSKGKRDYILSKEDGYYQRENLTKIIAANVHERKISFGGNIIAPIQDPVIMGKYDYGEIDIFRLDENYRTESNTQNNLKLYPRGEIERDIIHDTKQKNTEIQFDFIDTSELDRILQKRQTLNNAKRIETEETKKERLIREIQENLDTLSFVEHNKVYTYEQANAIISGLWDKHKSCQSALNEAKQLVANYDTFLTLPARLEFLQKKMYSRAGVQEYMSGLEFKKDTQAINTLKTTITKYGLGTPEGIEKFIQMKEKRAQSIKSLSEKLALFRQTISEYQKYMEILRRIDHEQGSKKAKSFYDYDSIFQPDIVKNCQNKSEKKDEQIQKIHKRSKKDRERG